MSYTNANDQPDWTATGGSSGDPVAAIAFVNNVPVTSVNLAVGSSPSLLVSINSLATGGFATVAVFYLDPNAISQFAVPAVIEVNGGCQAAVLIPNVGGVCKIQVSGNLTGVNLTMTVTVFQSGIAVVKPTAVTTGVLVSFSGNVAAGGNVIRTAQNIGTGTARFVINTAATSWTAFVYGSSLATELLMAAGPGAGGGSQTIPFALPAIQPTLFVVNNDAVVRAFTLSVVVA